MSPGPGRRWRLGRTDARTPGWVDREDRVSIIADHVVLEVAVNGLLLWALIIGTVVLVVVAVVTLLRGRIDPP
jgi:hypothetical protein